MAERDIKGGDSYIKKLNTLLPGEITGVYLAIRTGAQNDLDYLWYLLLFAVAIGFAFYFFAPQILQISDPTIRALYVVTFLLWVSSIEMYDISFKLGWNEGQFFIPAITTLWTFLVPFWLGRTAQ